MDEDRRAQQQRAEEQLAAFKRDGFAVFPGILSAAKVRGLRDILEPVFAEIFAAQPGAERCKLGDVGSDLYNNGAIHPLNSVPGGLMAHPLWPEIRAIVVEPWHSDEVLDFLQLVIGPVVQLEALGITGFPPRPELASTRRAKLIQTNGGQGWHRDGGITERYASPQYSGGYWGHAKLDYMPPSIGCNCLLYLQDMTDLSGRLHVVPGSHMGLPETPQDDDRWMLQVNGGRPTLPLALRAGDLVITHDELLHSGGFNTSEELRAYMSTKVCRLGLPHRDDFDTPAIRQRLLEARRSGDMRCLRFFGDPAGAEAIRTSEESSWRRMLVDEASARL
eukprot:COSAG06_NODE_1602_length_8958_cov_85.920194_7_plen_334_part_00